MKYTVNKPCEYCGKPTEKLCARLCPGCCINEATYRAEYKYYIEDGLEIDTVEDEGPFMTVQAASVCANSIKEFVEQAAVHYIDQDGGEAKEYYVEDEGEGCPYFEELCQLAEIDENDTVTYLEQARREKVEREAREKEMFGLSVREFKRLYLINFKDPVALLTLSASLQSDVQDSEDLELARRLLNISKFCIAEAIAITLQKNAEALAKDSPTFALK